MSQRKFTKRDGQRLHAKARARQRFGIEFTSEVVRNILRQIQYEGAHRLAVISNTRSVFQVEACGKVLAVVYDNTRKSICTVLPKGWWNHMAHMRDVNIKYLDEYKEKE